MSTLSKEAMGSLSCSGRWIPRCCQTRTAIGFSLEPDTDRDPDGHGALLQRVLLDQTEQIFRKKHLSRDDGRTWDRLLVARSQNADSNDHNKRSQNVLLQLFQLSSEKSIAIKNAGHFPRAFPQGHFRIHVERHFVTNVARHQLSCRGAEPTSRGRVWGPGPGGMSPTKCTPELLPHIRDINCMGMMMLLEPRKRPNFSVLMSNPVCGILPRR